MCNRRELVIADGPPVDVLSAYDRPPAPTAADNLTDPDRSTLRLSTGYPAEAYL